jgi:secondary thiamine-phosphate synthase enzyme
VTINENCDDRVCEDFLEALRKIAPRGQWKHDSCDGNGDSHIKSAIVGASITIPVQNNRLLLGKWQGIMFCEFDGPKERTVIVNCSRC